MKQQTKRLTILLDSEIQELKEEVRRLKREKEILKKVSALLMSEAFDGSR